MKKRTKNNSELYKTVGFKPGKRAILLIIAAVVVVAAVSGLMYYRRLNRVVFDEGMVYHCSGIDYDIPAGSRAIVDSNGLVTVDTGNTFDLLADEVPIYYRNKQALILTRPMGFYQYNLSAYSTGSQLEIFTRVEAIAGGVNISKGHKKKSELGSFLYDGEDTYVLLSAADLHIGENEVVHLSALSYITAVYDSFTQYFDSETGAFEYITYDFGDEYQPISVYFENGVILDCDLDSFRVGDYSVLISSAVKYFPNLL